MHLNSRWRGFSGEPRLTTPEAILAGNAPTTEADRELFKMFLEAGEHRIEDLEFEVTGAPGKEEVRVAGVRRAKPVESPKAGLVTSKSTPAAKAALAHYERFLALNDDEMEALVFAVTRAEGKDVVRTLFRAKGMGVKRYMRCTVIDTLSQVAFGTARFDNFGQLKFYFPNRIRPNLPTCYLMEDKVATAEPMVAKAVDAFVKEVLAEKGSA